MCMYSAWIFEMYWNINPIQWVWKELIPLNPFAVPTCIKYAVKWHWNILKNCFILQWLKNFCQEKISYNLILSVRNLYNAPDPSDLIDKCRSTLGVHLVAVLTNWVLLTTGTLRGGEGGHVVCQSGWPVQSPEDCRKRVEGRFPERHR